MTLLRLNVQSVVCLTGEACWPLSQVSVGARECDKLLALEYSRQTNITRLISEKQAEVVHRCQHYITLWDLSLDRNPTRLQVIQNMQKNHTTE